MCPPVKTPCAGIFLNQVGLGSGYTEIKPNPPKKNRRKIFQGFAFFPGHTKKQKPPENFWRFFVFLVSEEAEFRPFLRPFLTG